MLVYLIIGSTRPNRVGSQLAYWLKSNLPILSNITYELVDLKDWPLPILDEPALPSLNQYVHEHTKAWSKKISAADGYIFLTPEYNAGYPASLKNAIDYLYVEWLNKPALIISYGIRGGQSSSTQLKQVLERLKMHTTSLSPALVVNRDNTDAQGQIVDIDNVFRDNIPTINQAVKQLISLNELKAN